MELTDRQKQILRAIVDIYVSTAEPVGSKAIAALRDYERRLKAGENDPVFHPSDFGIDSATWDEEKTVES